MHAIQIVEKRCHLFTHSAPAVKPDRLPSMIPSRAKSAAERPMWAREAAPAAADSAARPRATSSGPTATGSPAPAKSPDDKKGDSAKGKPLSPTLRKLTSSSSSKPLKQSVSPTASPPRSRSVSALSRSKEGLRKDSPTSCLRRPFRPGQLTSVPVFKPRAASAEATPSSSTKSWVPRLQSGTATSLTVGRVGVAMNSRTGKPVISLASKVSLSSLKLSEAFASKRRPKDYYTSMKPSTNVPVTCARKPPPSPRKSTSSVSVELFQKSVAGRSVIASRKDAARPGDGKPSNMWHWRINVPPASASNTSDRLLSTPRISFADSAPSSAGSPPRKDRFSSHLPRRQAERRSTTSSTRETSESNTHSMMTATTSSGDVSAVAHLLSPAMLSSLASLVPSKRASRIARAIPSSSADSGDVTPTRRSTVVVNETVY